MARKSALQYAERRRGKALRKAEKQIRKRERIRERIFVRRLGPGRAVLEKEIIY